MEIGIVGAGLIGGTLARKLATAGHSVRIANSKAPSTLTEFAAESAITPMWATDAITGADLAIVTVPLRAVRELPADLLASLASVPIVIDTCNYYPVRDGHIGALDKGMPDSEWVASVLGRAVYKVFNNIAAPSLKYKGSTDPTGRVGLAVAGPDSEDKQTVFTLVDELGFDPVDGGTLEQSWRQQPGTPTYCLDLDASKLREGLVKTVQSKIGEYREVRDSLTDMDAAMQRTRDLM